MQQVSMDWAIIVILQVIFQPTLSVLFTVEAERSMYQSEFGGDVVLGCKFQPKPLNPSADLKVSWHWTIQGSSRVVYQMNNGVEQLLSPEYQGRVKLLSKDLQDGWAKLQISMLRISDSGNYQCLVQTGEGTDYKKITLTVAAPYKTVTKHIEKAAEGDTVLMTCQSQGYPESSVVWWDENRREVNSSITIVSTPDQLFNVTSQIRVRSSDRNNYTCNFTKDGLSATFSVPEEIPVETVEKKNDGVIVVLSIGLVMAVIIVAVLMYWRRKGSNTPRTRDLLVEGQNKHVSATACLQINKENEEGRAIFKGDFTEENLGVFLKTHYSEVSFCTEVRHHRDASIMGELPHRLQNNEGQGVKLQALLPEAGETLFLEGPPGSGKTTFAQILVTSWTEGSTHALTILPGLSLLKVLLYVDCSSMKDDLFQEIVTQLSLRDDSLSSTEDELRTALTTSSEALLLLDGYKEGNQFFDESLKRFLSERQGCRVLVMACPGHCPTLKQLVGTRGVLKLQTQTVKY